jgi:hypothetical protein
MGDSAPGGFLYGSDRGIRVKKETAIVLVIAATGVFWLTVICVTVHFVVKHW